MATYLHAIDGRLRVRLPELRGDRRAAARLRRELRALSGVSTVDANPLTGSVLVEYDADRLSTDEVLSATGVEAPDASDDAQRVSLFNAAAADGSTTMRDVVAEKVIELAAERLLLAVLT